MLIYNEDGKVIGEIYDKSIDPVDLVDPVDPPEADVFASKSKVEEIFNEATIGDLDTFYALFSTYAKTFQITTEFHENAFLAQIVAETGYGLQSVRENLNYTPASLRANFNRYKDNPGWSERDGRTSDHPADQVQIGNVAYADRLGNGPIESGDGYEFRGGGYFQLTGRIHYTKMADAINIRHAVDGKLSPENVADKIVEIPMGTLTAMAFWFDNDCASCEHIDCVTEKINYYTDSYAKRKEIYQWIATL